MKSLNFRFREFFSVDPMFFPEREMDSDLAFVEVDIREGSSGRDSPIEPHTEFSYHHDSFVLDDPVVQLRKRSREVLTREYLSVLDDDLKWRTMIHREILSRICFDQTFSVERAEIN